MQAIFIVGSAGNVGLRLVKNLTSMVHVVNGLYRHDEQSSLLKDNGGMAIKGSLTGITVEQLAEKMAGNNVVAFTAGAGIEVTNAIDDTGLELSSMRLYLLVSVILSWYQCSQRPHVIKAYLKDLKIIFQLKRLLMLI
jgi:hypothetical protein